MLPYPHELLAVRPNWDMSENRSSSRRVKDILVKTFFSFPHTHILFPRDSKTSRFRFQVYFIGFAGGGEGQKEEEEAGDNNTNAKKAKGGEARTRTIESNRYRVIEEKARNRIG